MRAKAFALVQLGYATSAGARVLLLLLLLLSAPFQSACPLALRYARANCIVHYLFHDVTWTVQPRCFINDVFVDPAARQGGVARKLMRGVYERALREVCAAAASR